MKAHVKWFIECDLTQATMDAFREGVEEGAKRASLEQEITDADLLNIIKLSTEDQLKEYIKEAESSGFIDNLSVAVDVSPTYDSMFVDNEIYTC